MAEPSAEDVRDWEMVAVGLANENERLKYAIRWMCTEMPVGWEEVLPAAVQDVVLWAVDGDEDL